MDASGSSLCPEGNNARRRKRSSDEENDRVDSLPSKKEKFEQPLDATQLNRNMSGVKSFLHGISYQIKLCIYVCLANAKRSMNSIENGVKFRFTVKAEDPDAGKFDDIVYKFQDGENTGTLKIQAKHTSKSPTSKITLKDLTTTKDVDDQFALLKYFTSFCDQQQSSTDMEGLIICTNWDLDDKTKDMWKKVEAGVTDDSSLDSYVSTLFDRIQGKSYQLDYDKVCTPNGTFSDFHQLWRQCSKCARLARLLIETIKSKKKITCNNSLYKQYRPAILTIIDREDNGSESTNGQYRFSKEFLDSSYFNAEPSYETFRKVFEDQYRNEFKIQGSVWDDLKLKSVIVAKAFVSDETIDSSSNASFPDDNVDECFKFFCERFRLVCGTYNEQGLEDVIAKLWRNLHFGDEYFRAGRQKGCIEETLANEKLFKTNFDWLMDPFAKPLHSEDLEKDLENIENTLTYMKMKGISDKLRRKVLGSPFRISHDAIKTSELYERAETEIFVEVEVRDIQFCVTLLLDILDILSSDAACTLFLNESEFTHDSYTIEKIIRFMEHPIHLFVTCNDTFPKVKSILRKWKRDFLKDSLKQVFLIGKTDKIATDTSCFCICDLTADSKKQFLNKNISLHTTTISADKIFPSVFRKLPIEEVIKVLDEGHKMVENNEIVRKYLEIEPTYVPRCWIDQEKQHESENLEWSDRNKMSSLLIEMHQPNRQNISFNELTESIKKHQKFIEIFIDAIDSGNEFIPIVDDKYKRIWILLAEAGCGKSTNLTWLAWHLRRQNPSWWVVRCNLSEYCTEFKSFTQDEKNVNGKVIDDKVALRMFYKLVHLSLQLERETAEKCSECLFLSDGEANVSDELMTRHGLSLNNKLRLLVFKEKFNAGDLVMLLDGFDEIAPHYKEVVLILISRFETFNGLKKLFLTSRPYGFKEQFKQSFENPSFFQLKPLTLQEKGSLLYRMMRCNGNNDYEEKSDFYKALYLMLLFHLDDMSDVPLNLMMIVEILKGVFDRYVNFSTKMIDMKFFKVIEEMCKASFMVGKFIEMRVQLIYCKFGAKENAYDNPILIDEYVQKLEQVKRKHGLVALRNFFSTDELNDVLTETEKQDAQDYMKKIHEANEKTGIINGIHEGVPMFIHRSFSEYFAACWVVKRQLEGKQQGRIKLSSLESFWGQKGLRRHIDTILAKNHHLHLAIIEGNWKIFKHILSSDSEALYGRDDGGRTPLHMLVFYGDFKRIQLLPKSIESNIINWKDKLLGRTAMDYMLHFIEDRLDADKICHFLYYLLDNGSINVEVLYEHVVANPGEKIIRKAAKYVNHVMRYLSHHGIEYKMHVAYKDIKQFCDKVAQYLINESSIKTQRNSDKDSNVSLSILKDIIKEDACWMLESVIQQLSAQPQIIQLKWNEMIDFALKHNSIFVLKYIVEADTCLLNKDLFWKCIVISVNHNYKNEFKWLVDLYFHRIEIKEFQPCSIHDDNANYLFQSTIKDDAVHALIENTKWNIPTQNMIDKNILCVLTLCAVMDRPSMVRYLKESCHLNLCAGHVYYLAMIVQGYWLRIIKEIDSSMKANYECLLNLATNITNDETTGILRLGLASDIFGLAECLVERCNLDIQVVDEFNGWNAFHFCVSDQYHEDCYQMHEARYSLFRCLLKKEKGMDCFGILDKRGRSILRLAFENGRYRIVDIILAHKLGLDDINEIKNLGVDALPNLIFCCREIHKITKSFEKEGLKRETFWLLATKIGKLLLNIHEERPAPVSSRLLRQEDIIDFYQFAVDCKSLSLMYYLHRKFDWAIPPSIRDASWLLWIQESLEQLNIRLFKYGVRQYCQSHLIPHPTEDDNDFIEHDEFNQCNADVYRPPYVNVNELVKRAEVTLSEYLSQEEVCIMQLVVIAICLKNVSAVKYLCETFELKIARKILIDIMEIAHHSNRYKCHGKTFNSIYEYLFERISDLHELDAEGRNLLHLSTQSRLGCMSMFMIEQNIFNITDINTQNGWSALHYSALTTEYSSCGDGFFNSLLQNVLQIESNEYFKRNTTENQRNKVKELCFNSDGGKQSVIHVAIEAGNILMATKFIELRLGICLRFSYIKGGEITTPDEYSRLKKCHETVDQIAAKLPFNSEAEKLLNDLAKFIDKFSLDFIKQTTGQYLVVDDVCRIAIKYRSVSTLEHLIIAYDEQIKQALVGSTSRELFACMMECIRQNRTKLFKVLVGHYCSLQGIQPSSEDEYEETLTDSTHRFWLNEGKINWSTVDQTAHDVTMNHEYIRLLILSVAHGRLSMTKHLCKMLQLAVDKPLILLIMKVLNEISYKYLEAAVPVYQYLTSKSEGNLNLLHMCVQAGNEEMLKYLIKESHLDANEIGGSVLHLALENGHRSVAEYIIYHRLGIKDDMKPWKEWDLEKIEKHINDLNQILGHLPTVMHSVFEEILAKLRFRKNVLPTYYQLFTSQTGS